METLTVEEMEQIDGGVNWACVGVGILGAAALANPMLLANPAVVEGGTILATACIAS